ncbi:uncharacterized protein LOC128892137 isoform X2 [Hylaeus anthracinus]|uniref:uncharacterized protein LOC128892137 isoform X2 n=1 Tax=Hylaeus anthracinus TaxID=313031 RepID=UPI0023B9791F|nr:uncharacterized protein LOC128892137 isoform X2 [Hylaeus anthracinus]
MLRMLKRKAQGSTRGTEEEDGNELSGLRSRPAQSPAYLPLESLHIDGLLSLNDNGLFIFLEDGETPNQRFSVSFEGTDRIDQWSPTTWRVQKYFSTPAKRYVTKKKICFIR